MHNRNEAEGKGMFEEKLMAVSSNDNGEKKKQESKGVRNLLFVALAIF